MSSDPSRAPHPTASTAAPSHPLPLELQGVAHRFGRRWVLRGLDLRVEPGEVVAVLGANGAGKTTLLRIAATLLRPLRGGGSVAGADLLKDPGRIRGKVDMLGHAPGLYEDLTPEENLRFSLLVQGSDGDPDRIRTILRRVGLEEHASSRVRSFSAGMRRRLAVGRILASLPHLLLMDEPYASLDPDGVALVNETIGQVIAAGGGVLLATHDVHSGVGVVTRTLTLDAGVLRDGGESATTTGARAGSGSG